MPLALWVRGMAIRDLGTESGSGAVCCCTRAAGLRHVAHNRARALPHRRSAARMSGLGLVVCGKCGKCACGLQDRGRRRHGPSTTVEVGHFGIQAWTAVGNVHSCTLRTRRAVTFTLWGHTGSGGTRRRIA